MLAAHTNQNLILADIQLVEQCRLSKKGKQKTVIKFQIHLFSAVLLILQHQTCNITSTGHPEPKFTSFDFINFNQLIIQVLKKERLTPVS